MPGGRRPNRDTRAYVLAQPGANPNLDYRAYSDPDDAQPDTKRNRYTKPEPDRRCRLPSHADR